MPSLSVKFYLESRVKGDDKKPLPIFLYLRHSGRTLKVFTERKCPRAWWDTKRGRANTRKHKSAIELNGFLSDLEEQSANLFNYNSRTGKITTKEQLTKLIQQVSGSPVNDQDFLGFAEEFVGVARLAPSTLKSYRTTIRVLEEFAAAKRKVLEFNDIDLHFYDDFTTWLWNKGLNDNSVGKHIKIIKSLMSQAFERDLHGSLHFKKKKFKVYKREGDAVYLTERELASIRELKLSNERLAKVRDAFLVASWTGLRFSDLARITREKFIIEEKIPLFQIESQKTGEIVKIPISPVVRPILEKYDYEIPVLSNQKMNEYLKELCKAAKIDSVIEVTDMRAGKKVRRKCPKYQLITTHTARRSFASNLYLQGVPSRSIMAVTGHRTEKAFLTYIKLSAMERIRAIDTHFRKRHKTKLKVA